MSEARELAGRTAIVTGGTRGIGRAIVEQLAGAGAHVLFTGRNQDKGAEAERAFAGSGGRAKFVAADQGSGEDWERVADLAQSHLGGLDILVLSAGVSGSRATTEMTLDEFKALNRINLKGAFLGLKHAAAAIRRRGRGGSIVIVSSIVGKIGVADHIHYSASKAGVRMMAKAAALELGPDKIRVNTIHPGMTRTDMIAGFPPEIANMIPLGRFGEPEEVAKAALFLASDRSIFMTGAEIVIDGGWTVQ